MVKGLDILKDGLTGLRTHPIVLAFCAFRFERAKETLPHSVVVAIPLATHTHHESILSELLLVVSTCILTSSI